MHITDYHLCTEDKNALFNTGDLFRLINSSLRIISCHIPISDFSELRRSYQNCKHCGAILVSDVMFPSFNVSFSMIGLLAI